MEEIQKLAGPEHVILGFERRVDSSVAAALIHKAINDQLTCIFVNNGVLRAREAETVQEVFGRNFKMKLQYEDASRLFLTRLKGVVNPERKRKIIGRTFIEVFQGRPNDGTAKFLAQGTSLSGCNRVRADRRQSAAMIKSLQCGRIAQEDEIPTSELLKCLFKDEVRQLGLELGLPREIVFRQPFPGPGLAVRILAR